MKKEKTNNYCSEHCCPNDGDIFEGGKKGFCHKYNKIKSEVEYCYKTFKGGWVTPEGVLIPSDFGAHDCSAREIIRERYPSMYERMRGFDDKHEKSRQDFLVNKGWILLTGNPYPGMGFSERMFIICHTLESISPFQHILIKKLQDANVPISGHVPIKDRLEDKLP